MAAPHGITTPPRGLTPAFIDSLRPAEARYELADRRAPGLRLRVMPSGMKVFRWYCNSRGKVFTIGPWTPSEQPGRVTLKQAHAWLERLKAAHAAGELEVVEAELAAQLRRRERVTDPAPEARRLFGPVLEEFYRDDILRNRKRPKDARRVLDNDLLPVLRARPLDAISTLDCRDVVKRAIDRGAPVHAGRVLAMLKQFFGWAQANGFTDRNPAAPLKGRHLGVETNISDRFLSAEEIPIFWKALDVTPKPVTVKRARGGKVQRYEQQVPTLTPATRTALRLLLLTAARTGELLRARWEHLDLEKRTWTIPVENQKLTKAQERHAKPFVIALPPTAVALFRELHDQADGSPWVLPGKARKAAEGDEPEPRHYDERTLGHALRRLHASKALDLPGGEVTPHDLRRTARTHLAKLKVPHWIVERVLNHSLGKIAATYDHHDYFDERREALERWDAFVVRLAAPEASNVVELVAGSAR